MRIFRLQPWIRRALTFTVVFCYLLMDLYEEFTQVERQGESTLIEWHHWFEIFVVLVVFWALWCEINGAERLRQSLAIERGRRQRLANDLAGHIAAQFSEWGLSQAETDIAWLLIKGFRFAEIAELRGVKEKTLRQQASQIYAKAGVAGRAELSAGFMEDLLGPNQPH